VERKFDASIGYHTTRIEGYGYRLHINESPYGPAPQVKKYLKNAVADASMYPDVELEEELMEAISQVYDVDEQQVVITNGGMGSLELLASMCKYESVAVYIPTFYVLL